MRWMETRTSLRKKHAPPPAAMFEALAQPRRRGARPWLHLLRDEQEPRILEATAPGRVVWSSLWPSRPDDRIVFLIERDGAFGSWLEWQLQSERELDDETLRQLRHRVNQLLNGQLRDSFDQ